MSKRWTDHSRIVAAVLLVCVAIWTSPGVASGSEKEAEAILQRLLTAVQSHDYEAFVADGTAEFRSHLTKHIFARVSAQLSERMKRGYSTSYLGQLKKQGYPVYLWKMTFSDQGDDVLIRLVLQDQKVGGFWLQ
jgi:negative regulator of sigma E activity